MGIPYLPPDQTVTLGPAWGGSSVNCVPFRREAIVSSRDDWVVAYYDDQGNVVVDFLDPAWRPIGRAVVACPVPPFDAHNCISVYATQDAIHLAFGAHSSALFCATLPRRVQGDLRASAEILADVADRHLTYPMFLPDPITKQPMLLVRRGWSSCGELWVRRYDPASCRFVPDDRPAISGMLGVPTAGPYVNSPIVLPDGGIALFYVWRLPKDATSAGSVANVGIDLILSPDGLRSFLTCDGIAIDPPITPVTSPRVWPVGLGAGLINQGCAAAAPGGTPMAITYWSDGGAVPQYRLLHRLGARWQVACLSAFATGFALSGDGTLPLPHSRPELVVMPDGTALWLFRSAEFGNRLMLGLARAPYETPRPVPIATLVDEDLGFYEPIIDRSAWHRDSSLVVYVQRCDQPQGDKTQHRAVAAGRLVQWSSSRFTRLD